MKSALQKNLNWFEKSGVMIPESGIWGVAERVAVAKNNEAIEKMYASFVAWTPHGDYSIIEQRRADCNFQAAYLYLLAYEVFGDKKYYTVAVNSIPVQAGIGLISNAQATSILMMNPGVFFSSWKLPNVTLNWIRNIL